MTDAYDRELAARKDLKDPRACLETLRASVGPHGTGNAFQAEDDRLGTFLIRRLADARLREALPLLARLAADPTPYSRNKSDALEAVRAIGGPDAAAAIVAELERVIAEKVVPWDAGHPTLFAMPMVNVLFEVDDMDPFDRLAPFFTAACLASPSGARITRDVLGSVTGRIAQTAHEAVRLLHPDGPARVPIGADRRWLDRLVLLLADRRLRSTAKYMLKDLPPLEVQAAFVRVAGPKTKAPPPSQPSPEDVKAASARAKKVMRAVRKALEKANETLKKAKYSPRAKGKCMLPSEADVDRVVTEGRIAELEKLTKTRLPELLRELYLVVGPIDFQRPFGLSPGPGIEKFAAAPRFQIVPLERAIKDVKRRLREHTGVPVPLRDPLALDVSGDGVEDAAVRVDAWVLDPEMESGEETLLGYLKRRIAAWDLPGVPDIPAV